MGRDYLAAMVREYDGDVSKALAAYNWGPGNLDRAVKEHGPNWLQAAPRKLRSYVERSVREFGAGASRSKRPSLAEIRGRSARRSAACRQPRAPEGCRGGGRKAVPRHRGGREAGHR